MLPTNPIGLNYGGALGGTGPTTESIGQQSRLPQGSSQLNKEIQLAEAGHFGQANHLSLAGHFGLSKPLEPSEPI